jgi:hypothetical protein
LKKIRYWIDPVIRETKDENLMKAIENKLRAGIPWLSDSLPADIDVAGKKRGILDVEAGETHYGIWDWVSLFFNPIITTRERNDTKGMRFMLKLYKMTGETKHLPRTVKGKELSYRGLKIKIDERDRLELQKRLGKKVNELFNELVENPSFIKATPEQQIDYVYKLLNKIGLQLREQFFVEKYKSMKGS